MRKTIAVIGAPRSIRSVICGSLAKAGYHVLLADPDTRRVALNMRSLQAGVETISCVREASWEADMILLAAPCDAYDKIASRIKDVVTGKVVISMANSTNGICDNSAFSAAEKLAQLLPHAKVVSAFNTILAPNFRKTGLPGKPRICSFEDQGKMKTGHQQTRTDGMTMEYFEEASS